MSLVDITSERERYLWGEASNKNEFATTEFWLYIFKEKIFRGPDFSIATEAPPSDDDDDKRRVDIIVRRWQPAELGKESRFTPLLFFEAKKHNASISEIDTLEHQAFTATCAWRYGGGGIKVPRIYAMTAIGSRAMLWYNEFEKDYLTEFMIPNNFLSEKASYIAAFSTDAQLLRDGFASIILYPSGPPQSPPSILASNATPPEHEDEMQDSGPAL